MTVEEMKTSIKRQGFTIVKYNDESLANIKKIRGEGSIKSCYLLTM